MRAAPSFRTPAALHATPPSAAEAPNSFVLRHLWAAPLESAVCLPLPLEDEGKVSGGTSLMFTCDTTSAAGSLHTNFSSILWIPHLSTVTMKVDRAGLWLYQGLWDPLLVPVREGTAQACTWGCIWRR
ncbi:uncharacterized protein LOC124665175 isoform X2 [Lolium rigidum]|uniref:uncharacterized protein LOC124665175 isoform X2 n=1 Tax=Lolium rigidum TaxID=89674 RepID=UPI001F5D3B1E|nr:uncharacterized protein LOC124665175 isoform X2 [Lolium rigidum]